MAERYTIGREIIRETIFIVPLPRRKLIFGIYRENNKIVVRKHEEIEGIRICLDEEYALNEADAEIILNIMYHKTNNFSLN